MKKLINGRRYDTDAAKQIVLWSDGKVTEVLHRKQTGEFFLHGSGDVGTQYAELVGGNTWKAGERLMPLTISEAQQWCRSRLTPAQYRALFSDSGEKKTVTFSLQTKTIEKIARLAADWNCTKSEVIERLME